jgi:hypothetical protein
MATKTSAAVPAYPRRPVVTAVIAKIEVSNSWCGHSLSMQPEHCQRVSRLPRRNSTRRAWRESCDVGSATFIQCLGTNWREI